MESNEIVQVPEPIIEIQSLPEAVSRTPVQHLSKKSKLIVRRLYNYLDLYRCDLWMFVWHAVLLLNNNTIIRINKNTRNKIGTNFCDTIKFMYIMEIILILLIQFLLCTYGYSLISMIEIILGQ